ncbi:hypothetical protein V2J09_005673 [Rumex salicifolius]
MYCLFVCWTRIRFNPTRFLIASQLTEALSSYGAPSILFFFFCRFSPQFRTTSFAGDFPLLAAAASLVHIVFTSSLWRLSTPPRQLISLLAKEDHIMNQPLPPKDERIDSPNPSSDAPITGPPGDGRGQPAPLDVGSSNNTGYPLNAFPSMDHYYYGGYDTSSNWSGYPQYAGADGLQVVPPVMYGDNTALGLHSLYGYSSPMTYGQYSPVSTPVPPMVVDNQLFSPQQVPFPQSYYPQAVATSVPHISAPAPNSQDVRNIIGHHLVDSGSNTSFYNLHGMFGSAESLSNASNPVDLPRRTISPMTSIGPYTQPGTMGSYNPNVAQASQQRPMSGYGLPAEFFTSQYPYDTSNQYPNFAGFSSPQPAYSHPSRHYLEKGRSHREQVPTFVVSGERNRGPRALKVKGKSSMENSTATGSSIVGPPGSVVKFESLNLPEFPTEPENAKFFIIKSFSEDNVHRSIKYGVWASTLHGNKKLNDAFQEAKESGNCPVYLFFSVNASSQFCGLAEMAGPVDFEKNADYWQQDRWTGQFPVIWHIVKDVPNNKFRHILLENNDNKPVTHSRDSQEVALDQGIEMLKIFKEHEVNTSILDDFDFYDERERVLQERKNREVAKLKTPEPVNKVGNIDDISDRLDETLKLEDDTK